MLAFQGAHRSWKVPIRTYAKKTVIPKAWLPYRKKKVSISAKTAIQRCPTVSHRSDYGNVDRGLYQTVKYVGKTCVVSNKIAETTEIL